MNVVLGIDTGGTYTDAALVDHDSGGVLAGAKALTTRHDLAIGIEQAVRAVMSREAVLAEDVRLVALSTTLATNAIVEGQGRSVGLLLIGYDPDLVRQYDLERELATQRFAYVRGGHNVVGEAQEPLDEDAARETILSWRDEVEGFAISGFFGVYNPAHELRVKELVQSLTGLPVTCGHELTSRLDSVRRATTAALNAQLIPLLHDLIATVRRALDRMGIAAPLMVVKGDGSLVRAPWAMERPIETILSGPAASVVGAWHLAGRRDVWTVDVGGTTTDIAALDGGRPRRSPRGASVGGWRTMVEAADVHTVGLGGDSRVCLNGSDLLIGPQRVIPLSLLAHEYPATLEKLRLLEQEKKSGRSSEFIVRQRKALPGLSAEKRALLNSLRDGPRALTELAAESPLASQWVRSLETRQIVLRAAFTPTDALHALGRIRFWNGEAALIGARMLARENGARVEEFCARVIDGVSDRVSQALVTKVLSDEGSSPDWDSEPSAMALLRRALGKSEGSDLACDVKLQRPVVAIGAPVEAYMPRVADQLSTELVIPSHAEVANAVGAVTGSVVQQILVNIQPLGNDTFRVHLPGGVRDFSTLTEGVRHAEDAMTALVKRMAQEAGAEQVDVWVEREDKTAPVLGNRIYLGTEMRFTAAGRPSLAA